MKKFESLKTVFDEDLIEVKIFSADKRENPNTYQ